MTQARHRLEGQRRQLGERHPEYASGLNQLALLLIMHGVAWLLNDLVFNNFWAGFFIEAALFLLVGAAAGLFAWRSFKRAAPPTPDMAIEEAKEIKAAFGDGEEES